MIVTVSLAILYFIRLTGAAFTGLVSATGSSGVTSCCFSSPLLFHLFAEITSPSFQICSSLFCPFSYHNVARPFSLPSLKVTSACFWPFSYHVVLTPCRVLGPGPLITSTRARLQASRSLIVGTQNHRGGGPDCGMWVRPLLYHLRPGLRCGAGEDSQLLVIDAPLPER